jgi:hypothetical protein
VEDAFPHIPKELIEELDNRFPERCPDPLWTDREIWIKAGERRLVKFLLAHYERQNSNILEKKLVLRTPGS